MNIFYLDSQPIKAAQFHGDRHVLKMILESAQLLSTAHHLAGSDPQILANIYRPTHINHPSAIWVRSNKANYTWLFHLFVALLDEYTFRYGKSHKSQQLIPYLSRPPAILSEETFFAPPLVMDEKYVTGDAIASYRNYYRQGKRHLHQWTKREVPSWLNVDHA